MIDAVEEINVAKRLLFLPTSHAPRRGSVMINVQLAVYERCRSNDVRTSRIRSEFLDVPARHAPTGGIAALVVARIIVNRGSQQEHIPNNVRSPRCKNGPQQPTERVSHEVDLAGCRVVNDDVREFLEGGADSRRLDERSWVVTWCV